MDASREHLYISSLSKIIRYDFEGTLIDEHDRFRFPEYVTFQDGAFAVFLSKLALPNASGGFYNLSTRYTLDQSWNMTDSLQIKRIDTKNQMSTSYPRAKYTSASSEADYLYYPVLIPEPMVRDTLFAFTGSGLEPMYTNLILARLP